MEKVWEELKRIEAKAEQIRVQAQDKSKEINALAKEKADKLLADAKKYADQEAQDIHSSVLAQAEKGKEEKLSVNQQTVEKIRQDAQERMGQAVDAIVKAVLEKH